MAPLNANVIQIPQTLEAAGELRRGAVVHDLGGNP
jgi:hypothetical protein